MVYVPKPIDTSGIELSPALNELIERLAESNHDIWARQRLKDGWRFGPNRDDNAKTHPDLKPYNELSDNEKQYDRNSVVETLKAIITLGYKIEKE